MVTAVKKLSVFVPVSCCLLTDTTGEQHCEHEPYAPPPDTRSWHVRWRAEVKLWVWARRLKLGMKIAGLVDTDLVMNHYCE
jgi:hypothetical protein